MGRWLVVDGWRLVVGGMMMILNGDREKIEGAGEGDPQTPCQRPRS